MKKFKNILHENMQRFATKNLNEAPENFLQRVKTITDRSTVNRQTDPVTMLRDLYTGIHGVLNYYEKTEDGKFIDKETKVSSPVDKLGGYYKPQIESIMFSARPGGVNETRLSEMETEKTKIINSGPFKEFFGDYDAIKYTAFDKDWYTGEKCSLMKPKSPACISTATSK